MKDEDMKKMVVDTSKDNGIPLKLRSTPRIEEDNIITKIPNKTILNVNEEDLEDEKDFVEVEYIDEETKKVYKGYVSSKYLQEYKEKKEYSSERKNYTTNDGEVMGIDVNNTMDPEKLEQIIKGEIPIEDTIEYANSDNIDIDLSQYENKEVNYVYIKMGASGYGKGDLSFTKTNENFVELAKICEENQIPYGFYYYSTSINEEEAQMEKDRIMELQEMLEENGCSGEYNQLPLAIDVELAQNDRQAGKDVTDAKE